MSCKNCREETEIDRFGEAVHTESGKYGCEPGKRGQDYPVAR